MQNNPEIEAIVEESVRIARNHQHEYVLTEHLLLALVRHVPFRKVLEKFGVTVDVLEAELDAYIRSLVNLVKNDPDLQPRKTQALERLFNRATFK